MTSRPLNTSSDGFRCGLCGDVIGVYEPLVLCSGSVPYTTSRAAEPKLDPGDACYHSACFARRHGGTPA